MIEILGGEGTIEKRIPAMFRMYMNYGVDMRKSADRNLPYSALPEWWSGN